MISAVKFLQFWEKVDNRPEGCWLWTASTNHRGYGKFDGGYAHRFSLEWFIGPAPHDKPFALHSCDVKSCVNPIHLRWGTHAENMAESSERGRNMRGSDHTSAKLNESDIEEIRWGLELGQSQYELASEFGVSQSIISDIATGKIWKHV